jgi:hypothetical protein
MCNRSVTWVQIIERYEKDADEFYKKLLGDKISPPDYDTKEEQQ